MNKDEYVTPAQAKEDAKSNSVSVKNRPPSADHGNGGVRSNQIAASEGNTSVDKERNIALNAKNITMSYQR